MSVTVTPDRVAQRQQALQRANAVRQAAAQVKRDIAAGTLTVREALSDPRAATITAAGLLRAQVGWERFWVNRALRGLPPTVLVASDTRVGTLTARQRSALADRVDELSGGFARRERQRRTRAAILDILAAAEGPLTSAEVAERLGDSASAIGVGNFLRGLRAAGAVSAIESTHAYTWQRAA